ncbi:hypothetical protein [Clostridium cellulovorans]|uniref:Uncharacterized protein n=1 Tax=Clostridium cellulovorans (strain ATCC 35296 / DSM 3052 / OCM 3 / 743B) TaxID=573061 RepID=D9SKR9_CLOC7|nr:hypothetical protein [Clostridium cellulovorans]ADL53491.1 hypothetical protein Clocel_3821 [Clostridium cellulovorans 743B]
MKIRNFFSNGFAIVLVLSMLIVMIFDTDYDRFYKLAMITSIALILIFSIGIQMLIDRNKFSREVNMAISIGSGIGIGVIFTSIIIAFAIASVFNKDKIGNENIPLILVDFGINGDYQYEVHVDNYKSVLSQQTKYWVDESELSYFVFESKYSWVINFYENRLVKRLRDIKDGMEIYHSNLPDGINVYKDKEGESFVLVASNKIIDIKNSPDGISSDEILNIVYNKLLVS